jgi:putative membrane protein
MMYFGGWVWILWIEVIGLVIWGVIALVRRTSSTSNTSKKSNPLEIAKERYARGEITKEEFEQIKKDLI